MRINQLICRLQIKQTTIIFFIFLFQQPFAATQSSINQNIQLSSGEEISAEIFGRGNPQRVLWIGPSFGIHPRHKQIAEKLAKTNMEVWQFDLPEALFMPTNADTIREIPGSLVADIINILSKHGQRKLLIISSTYGAIPTLRGIYSWQSQEPKQNALIGAIIFSPYLYTHVPSLGSAPTFIPETAATNIPIYIFQAEKNTNRWHLPAMLELLQGHAPVYTEIMNGVTAVFYEEDTAPETIALLQTLPDKIIRAVSLLQRHSVPTSAIPLPDLPHSTNRIGLNAKLKPYTGSLTPTTIKLTDTNGQVVSLDNFKGKVTLINFWAIWCPPCVEEIPSLNRLKKLMQNEAFQLISVNYAETPENIRAFLQKVSVDFPVLVDPQGKLAGQWKVVAFPSTFIIGPDGKFHYGVNAAIHWDTPEILQSLKQLLHKD